MKRTTFALTIVVTGFFALAQAGDDMRGAHAAQPTVGAPKVRTGSGSGVVIKTDPGKSAVTLKHGPIAALDMSGMTMAFPVKDKAMLAKLQPNQKVDFTLSFDGANYLITEIK